MADLPSCPVRLNEARTALHALQTGTQAVETWTRTGLRSRYTEVNIEQLKAYVRELEAECGGPDGTPLPSCNRRRPLGIYQ